jgi:hypothetical protein
MVAWETSGAAALWLLLFPVRPWRREGRLEHGSVPLWASSGWFCSWHRRVLPHRLLLAQWWSQGHGCRGGRGGLVHLQRAPLRRLEVACFVSPSRPNGCRAPAPAASVAARASLPPHRSKWLGSPVVVRWPVRSDSVGGLVETRRI